MTRYIPLVIAIALVAVMLLGGCAVTTVVSLGLTAATGKGLTEHALSMATGKDCNVLGAVLEKDRNLCEEPGSEATKHDFKGFFHGDEDKPVAVARKPAAPKGLGLVRINGKLVYTMAPVVTPGDIAHAKTVRALPRIKSRKQRSGDSKPVLLRVNGKLIYTMAPVARTGDIHGGSASSAAPVRVKPAQSR